MFVNRILTGTYQFSKYHPLHSNTSDSCKSLNVRQLETSKNVTGYIIYILFIISTLRDLFFKCNGLRFLGVTDFAPIYQRLAKNVTAFHKLCLTCARALCALFISYNPPPYRKYPLPVTFSPKCLSVSNLECNGLNPYPLHLTTFFYKHLFLFHLTTHLPVTFLFCSKYKYIKYLQEF